MARLNLTFVLQSFINPSSFLYSCSKSSLIIGRSLLRREENQKNKKKGEEGEEKESKSKEKKKERGEQRRGKRERKGGRESKRQEKGWFLSDDVKKEKNSSQD